MTDRHNLCWSWRLLSLDGSKNYEKSMVQIDILNVQIDTLKFIECH